MKIMTNLSVLDLYDKISSRDNIIKSIFKNTYNKSKASRASYDTMKLYSDVILEELIYLLQNFLYYPTFKQFTLFDRKLRLIISPKTENSLVQRCIYEVVYQDFFNHFSPNVHSCIENHSTITANKQIRKRLNKHKNKGCYYLKSDFSNFFGSINSALLFDKLTIHIKDPRVLHLLSLFVFHSRGNTGIPFGNLLSQLFGNFYVTEMDFNLNGYNYTRFADDIIIINTLPKIREALDIMDDFCSKNALVFSYKILNKVKQGFKFCGTKHNEEFSYLSNRHTQTEAYSYNNINKRNLTPNKID